MSLVKWWSRNIPWLNGHETNILAQCMHWFHVSPFRQSHWPGFPVPLKAIEAVAGQRTEHQSLSSSPCLPACLVASKATPWYCTGTHKTASEFLQWIPRTSWCTLWQPLSVHGIKYQLSHEFDTVYASLMQEMLLKGIEPVVLRTPGKSCLNKPKIGTMDWREWCANRNYI